MKQVMHEAIRNLVAYLQLFHQEKGDYLPKKGPERYFEPRTANIRQHQQQQFYNDNQL